jgi:hypothetical protein
VKRQKRPRRPWSAVIKDIIRDLGAYPIIDETWAEFKRALFDVRPSKERTSCRYNWPGEDGVVHKLCVVREMCWDPFGEGFMVTRKITQCERFKIPRFSPRATRKKVTCLACLSQPSD